VNSWTVVHLWITRTLTAESKRVWWNEFGSAQVWSALSEYLSSSDLAAGAARRALESLSELRQSAKPAGPEK